MFDIQNCLSRNIASCHIEVVFSIRFPYIIHFSGRECCCRHISCENGYAKSNNVSIPPIYVVTYEINNHFTCFNMKHPTIFSIHVFMLSLNLHPHILDLCDILVLHASRKTCIMSFSVALSYYTVIFNDKHISTLIFRRQLKQSSYNMITRCEILAKLYH